MVYGFRYYSGRKTTFATNGKIAGRLVAFYTKIDRKYWIENEKRTAPSGCEGGERIEVTRKKAIKLVGIEEFEIARNEYRNLLGAEVVDQSFKDAKEIESSYLISHLNKWNY